MLTPFLATHFFYEAASTAKMAASSFFLLDKRSANSPGPTCPKAGSVSKIWTLLG